MITNHSSSQTSIAIIIIVHTTSSSRYSFIFHHQSSSSVVHYPPTIIQRPSSSSIALQYYRQPLPSIFVHLLPSSLILIVIRPPIIIHLSYIVITMIIVSRHSASSIRIFIRQNHTAEYMFLCYRSCPSYAIQYYHYDRTSVLSTHRHHFNHHNIASNNINIHRYPSSSPSTQHHHQ